MTAQIGFCTKCWEQKIVLPLHGEKGGPLTCMACGIDWHAEHGKKRKAGRLVVKALKLYLAAGGSQSDVSRLTLAASGLGLGFIGIRGDTTGAEAGDITKELLEDAIRLTHPDRHPEERHELAHRVTQELIALRPFVFPAPKPEPLKPVRPRPPRNGSDGVSPRDTTKAVTKYPCEICVDTVPMYYCTECKARWDKDREKEHERKREQRQRWKERARARRLAKRPKVTCAVCGGEFSRDKRSDTRYCSSACRQAAHRQRKVTDKATPDGEKAISRNETVATEASHP